MYNSFEEYYEEAKKLIDKYLEEHIIKDDKEIQKILDFSLKGGKRFRPVLCLLCCDVLRGKRDEAIKYAAVIECIHCSSLLHDDVIDNDVLRREKPTLWVVIDKLISTANKVSTKIIGRPISTKKISLAILAGDALLAKALLLVNNPEAIEAISKGIYLLLKGAVKEAKEFKKYVTRPTYINIITMKTASLFATACYLGASTSDASKKDKELCRLYGKNLGILYQILDDMIDEDVPEGINAKDLIVTYMRKTLDCVDKINGDEKYKKLMKEAVLKVLEKFAKKEGTKEILEVLEECKEIVGGE